jgi:hypothetical protein
VLFILPFILSLLFSVTLLAEPAPTGHSRLGTQIFANVSGQRDAKDINKIIRDAVRQESIKVLSEANALLQEQGDASSEIDFLSVRADSPPHERLRALSQLDEFLDKPISFNGDFKADLNEAAKFGSLGLFYWQSQVDPKIDELSKEIEFVNDESGKLKEIRKGGQKLFGIKKHLSEGNNVQVYETDKGTALKLLKKPQHARKQLLQAWSEPVVKSAGINTAKVLSVEPNGLYLEQELIPGNSLEYQYGFSSEPIPKKLQANVLEDWRKLRKLAETSDIWLDPKGANYHVRDDGTLVNVDFTPRLNGSYYRFFDKKPGTPLTDDEYANMFFRYDADKGLSHRIPASVPLKQVQAFNCDFDDNIFVTPAEIMIWDKVNQRKKGISTANWALIKDKIGKPGDWENFELRPEDGLVFFGDTSPDGLDLFKKQIERALEAGEEFWKGPSWDAFVEALSRPETRKHATIITARLHSPEAIMRGLKVLYDRGLIPALPDIENIFSVGWKDLPEKYRGADAAESKAKVMMELLDRIQEEAVPKDARLVENREGNGKEKLHLWGFSDDDFGNFTKARDMLAKEVAKGRWKNIKIVLHYTGRNNPDERPRSEVIMSNGKTRLALPAEGTRMHDIRGLLSPEEARRSLKALIETCTRL